MTSVRSGELMPLPIWRVVSSSSEDTMASSAPGTGFRLNTGRLPPSSRQRHAGTPRRSRSWRRCAGPRRGSRCSARRSRHGARSSTSHSVSTPPPSPPRAQIRRVMGGLVHVRPAAGATTAPRRACKQALVPLGVLHHLGAVEARAQGGRMGVLAAQAAADAAVDHDGHRVHLQRIGVVLDGEGGAARQADAGVVAIADVLVDAVLHAHHALALLQQAGDPGLDAALPLELALALGDDDLQAVEVAGEGFLQRLAHLLDA